jgi:hypothetical protein
MELDNDDEDDDVQPLTFIKDVMFESALYGTFHISHVCNNTSYQIFVFRPCISSSNSVYLGFFLTTPPPLNSTRWRKMTKMYMYQIARIFFFLASVRFIKDFLGHS